MRAHDGPTITNDHRQSHHHSKARPDRDLVVVAAAASASQEETAIVQKDLTRSSRRRRRRHRCCNWSVYCWLLTIILVGWLVPTDAGPRYSSRIVETKSGAIRGVILELNSKYLEPVEVFKAVPYATPPIGNLRFEPPKKLPPWKGTKLADTFGAVCPQSFPDINNRTSALLSMPKGRYQHLKRLLPLLANQSEDCLTLNIYVPGSGSRGLEAPYSIFFYIHGESYDWGSGNPYDGSVLASYGHVIVVTVNFRLGILGFLKTRASTSPGSGGNLGLMDIILALQWVRDNIAAFGGDPKRITLAGHDTGAALANMVLISKAGKGLIHRAILLSGSALSPWALIPEPDAIRLEVSQQMACHLLVDPPPGKPARKPSTDDITECLRDKPLEALMGVRLTAVRFMPSWGPFLPLEDSLDPEFAMEHSGEGFITSELMLGMTTTESYNDFSAADIQYGLEEEQRNRLLRTYIRNAFTFHLNEIFSAVRNEYTDWDKPIQHPINIRDSTMEALSDGHTVAPLIKVAYLHARRGAKTYMFHFGYQSKESEYPQRLGSVRGEDLPYILGLPLVQGVPSFPQNYSRQDMGVNEAVLNFVSNFCKTGDPNEAGHQAPLLHPDYGTAKERTRFRGITWDTFETTTQQYLSISTKPKMRSHYRGHKMALWLNLIPQLHRPGDPEVSMRHHHFRERDPHYYAGSVRAESFSRPRMYGNGIINDAQESRLESFGTECTPDPTMGEVLQEGSPDGGLLSEEEEEELLEKLANRHYYSYTAALGVTVGVGCLLLLLNMLIFAGIYYQRDRSRRRKSQTSSGSGSGSGSRNNGSPSPDEADIPLTTIPSPSPSKAKRSHEPPPSYATLPKRNSGNNHQHHLHQQQQQQTPPGTKDTNLMTATLGRTGSFSHKQQNILPETFASQQHTALTITSNEPTRHPHQHPSGVADAIHHHHHQSLPRSVKSAPLPPIRSSSNNASSPSPVPGSPQVAAISSSTSPTPPSSMLLSAAGTQTGTPLTSILVNSNNHQHHHHQHRLPQQHMAGGSGNSNSNIITVDLVSSTNPKHSGGGGGSSCSPHSTHFIGSASLGNNSSNTHHHHHHLHHHASGGGAGAAGGTVGGGSVGSGGSGNLVGSMANQNQPSTSTSVGMNPGPGSSSTLKKRVQIQEVTV
ncbi:neuroligin-1-like isoform X2 [Topomyia yanbarensis]|uniref:neuroligin-1-like isoform X2 n=1 Tax=Topomyia yanbarensis TaxID=2498891 RepID=UPI00273B61CA|nr:neuroligin-1-like isoform X2 [Topomyia yanbarensis]